MAPREQTARTSRWLVGAWTSVALIPVVLVGVSYASLIFFRETRYEGADHFQPQWTDGMPLPLLLLQGLICVAIFSIPCLLAVWCGRRATRAGDPRGRAPERVGIIAVVGYALMTVLSTVTSYL